jgi:hypothetical protein
MNYRDNYIGSNGFVSQALMVRRRVHYSVYYCVPFDEVIIKENTAFGSYYDEEMNVVHPFMNGLMENDELVYLGEL